MQPSQYQVQTQWDFGSASVAPDAQGDFVDAAPPQWDLVDPPAPVERAAPERQGAAQDAAQPYPKMAPIEQYLMERDAKVPKP